ncbi:MAG: nucleotide exchange factor GrpE [Clostridia bacterium]|nr:nucleotide exchange factor GrpE [Clostridia bacterium]
MDEEKVESVVAEEKPKKKKSAHAEEIEKLTAERDEYKDRMLRVTADFDNFRKRNADSTQRTRRDGANDVLVSMLDVLDNLERAYAQVVDESDKKGVELIIRQMADVLKSNGVEEIKAEGEDFNPDYHNAVMQEEQDGIPEGKVLAVFQKGYTCYGKVIRYSMVKVSK